MPVGSKTFARGTVRIAPVTQRRNAVRQPERMVARAYLREYPDPEFIAEVKETFPEKPIANVEEGRVRMLNAYSSWLLDLCSCVARGGVECVG